MAENCNLFVPTDAFPHCQTEPHNRVECGYSGISGVPCKQRGCCWSPTAVAGAPWCFAKSCECSMHVCYHAFFFGNMSTE